MPWIRCPKGCFFEQSDLHQSFLMTSSHRKCPLCHRVFSASDFKIFQNQSIGLNTPTLLPLHEGETLPGRAFLFILADEILPSKKIVRKVIVLPADFAKQYPSKSRATWGQQLKKGTSVYDIWTNVPLSKYIMRSEPEH